MPDSESKEVKKKFAGIMLSDDWNDDKFLYAIVWRDEKDDHSLPPIFDMEDIAGREWEGQMYGKLFTHEADAEAEAEAQEAKYPWMTYHVVPVQIRMAAHEG